MISGQAILERLNKDLWLPIKAIFTANRDYPYHDFETATLTAGYIHYRVGDNNIGLEGTQAKNFVSKSTLIMSTVNSYVRFNSNNNVIHTLVANNWYTFKSNITDVFYAYVQSEGTIYIYVEGVLPHEARSAHF